MNNASFWAHIEYNSRVFTEAEVLALLRDTLANAMPPGPQGDVPSVTPSVRVTWKATVQTLSGVPYIRVEP